MELTGSRNKLANAHAQKYSKTHLKSIACCQILVFIAVI
jgi:hypothetical protein